MSPREARMSYPPEEFEGQCTAFPDQLFGANLNPHCRIHDWHYQILRDHKGEWSRLEWDRFKEWADLCLYAGVRLEMMKARGPRIGRFIARMMWAAVRSKLGEAAADGSW